MKLKPQRYDEYRGLSIEQLCMKLREINRFVIHVKEREARAAAINSEIAMIVSR